MQFMRSRGWGAELLIRVCFYRWDISGPLQDLCLECDNLLSDLISGFKDKIAIAVVQCYAGVGKFFDYFNKGMIEKAFMAIHFGKFYHCLHSTLRSDA